MHQVRLTALHQVQRQSHGGLVRNWFMGRPGLVQTWPGLGVALWAVAFRVALVWLGIKASMPLSVVASRRHAITRRTIADGRRCARLELYT